jgi:ribosomal protein S18 acetylase RimI-like enzyme
MLPRAAAELGISYRPMTHDDVPFVARLYASTRAEEVAATGWPQAAQDAFLTQQHQAQHRHYAQHYPDAERLIVEYGGEPIGRLYWREEADQLHVIDISLAPERRDQGLGGAILRDLLATSRAAGKAVTIHVEKMNRARHLYERLGFEVTEDQGIYDLMRWTP